MKPFTNPDRDEYYSRVDDEIRQTEYRWMGGGLDVGIVVALMITALAAAIVGLIVLLWQAFTG